MARTFHPSDFVPRGFHVESVADDGAMIVVTVRHKSKTGRCPDCDVIATHVHSRYLRRLSDLPLAGRQVRLVVVARCFRCDAAFCPRATFTERFDADVLAPRARRTARLDCLVHHLGLALGGQPAANLARRLMLPVSNDTLLRVVRRRGCPPILPPIVVGIDDVMIRKKTEAELDAWIESARSSLVTSFANGVAKDKAAVRAAIASTWSNGQTEGQITKLKLVKRQMYGRAKLAQLFRWSSRTIQKFRRQPSDRILRWT